MTTISQTNMKTTNKNHTVWVGLFIGCGMLLLVSAIFFLGGQQKKFVKKITVKAVFNDINGLQPGSNIWLFGVHVGIVKEVKFFGESKVEITMSLEKDVQSRIHIDATAKISSDGFIGNKIIVLTGGNPTLPYITDGGYINVAAVTNTEEMMSTLQENNKNLLEITNNIKSVSAKLAKGEGSLGQLLNDTIMSSNLNAAIAHFNNVSQKSEIVLSNVQKFSEGLSAKGTLANELVSDTVVFRSLRNTFTNLHATSEKLNQTTLKIESITDDIKSAVGNTKKPIGMLLNDEKVSIQLKSLIDNLESGSKKLDEDLEAVQHNFLLKGYFKKQNKLKQKEQK